MVVAAIALSVVAQAGPIKLASPGLQGVQLPREVVAFYSDHVAQQLSLRGVSAITASEIASLIGLDRQKQLLGCATDSSSCLAELSAALGVDGIITGSVGHFGNIFQVNLKVVSAGDGRQLAVFSGTADDEAHVLELLTRGAALMAPDIFKALKRAPPAAAAVAGGDLPVLVERPGGARRWSWIPAAVAVVALGIGTGLMITVGLDDRRVRTLPAGTSYSQAQEIVADAGRRQTAGISLWIAGGAAALAAAAMFLFGAAPEVALAPSDAAPRFAEGVIRW